MPKVGNKKFDYDKEGIKKAKKAKRKLKKVAKEVSRQPLIKAMKRSNRKR